MADLGGQDTATQSLSANQFPTSSGWEPNGALRTIETGPSSADLGGKVSAPMRTYEKDGDQVTIGTKADAAWSGSGSGSLIAILKKLYAVLTGTLTVSESNSASIKTDLDTLSGAVSSSKVAVKSADGDQATLGAKADAKSNATDTTAVSAMQVLKQISYQAQNPAALPSHQSTNVDQWNGTTTDTNSGVKSAGTLRVVLATDQPSLTNKLLVTPDSIALPAHQSTNVDQLNGTTTDTNSGVKSAGTLRVVLATDQPALTNKLLVTPDSVALPAHQSTNVDQLNGTTTDTNSGSKSAGTLRVVLATDQPQLTNALLTSRSSVSVYSATQTNQGTGNSGDLTVGAYTELCIDINITANAQGTNPTLQFQWTRKAADGLYYPLWISELIQGLPNNPSKISTSIGAGMEYPQSLGVTGRLEWTVGGTSTPEYTFTANVQGK